jgi:ABC-type dipeptide/oligopeptide/nickel transport system permease subunit
VGSTLRLYYDAVIAVALMAVVAIVCGFIAAVITGDKRWSRLSEQIFRFDKWSLRRG